MNDSDTANSRGGSSSNESSSTSDCGSEHSSGSAAADRKRRRSVSKGRKPTAAQGSKRSKRPANSRAEAVSESAVEPPASPRRRARLQVVELPEGVMRVGGMVSGNRMPLCYMQQSSWCAAQVDPLLSCRHLVSGPGAPLVGLGGTMHSRSSAEAARTIQKL